jgi:hypothetical protein
MGGLAIAGVIVAYALFRPTPGARDPETVADTGTSAAIAGVGAALSGCWRWFNGATVRFERNGTVSAPPFTGQWKRGDHGNAVLITWPAPVDTVTISPDGRVLNGGNQYGVPAGAVRLSGRGGLEGSWRWANGLTATFAADGTGMAGPFASRWTAAGGRTYQITWPPPVDALTLSPQGDRLDGANQYGVSVSGAKLDRCAERP